MKGKVANLSGYIRCFASGPQNEFKRRFDSQKLYVSIMLNC